jgi:IPT/TIG domain/Viral BACON domain
MSQAPFSIPDAYNLVGGSHVLTKHGRLNHLLGKRRLKAKVKYLVGIVAVALLLLGSLLTACGNATQSTGSASPTSNRPSLSHTSTSTAGPARGSGSGSTPQHEAGPNNKPPVVQTADPRSFTVIEREFNFEYSVRSSEPPVEHITLKNSSNLPLNWSVSVIPPGAKAWLKLNPSSGNLRGSTKIDLRASNLEANLPPRSYVAYLVWSPVNPKVDNSVKVTLTVYPPPPPFLHVLRISPASGPAAGGTKVTIAGNGFTRDAVVLFDSTKASNVTVVSDTQITADSPAGDSGTVHHVTVTTPGGVSATSDADQFTYT